MVELAKARTSKQLAADAKRSRAMKGKKPAFLKGKSGSTTLGRRKSPNQKKSNGPKETTLPLAIIIPASIPLVKALTFDPRTGENGFAFNRTTEGAKQTVRSLGRAYAGYDMDTGEFDLTDPAITYGTLFLGIIGHKLAAKANRILGSSKVPLIRI